MPDFSVKSQIDPNQIIQTGRMQGQVPTTGQTIANVLPQAIQKGLQLTSDIEQIVQRNKRKQAIAQLIQSPDFQAVDKENDGLLGFQIQAGNLDSAVKNYFDIKKKDKQETLIVPDENNIEWFQKTYPGYSFQVGIPTPMERQVYNQGLIAKRATEGAESKENLEKLKIKGRMDLEGLNFKNKIKLHNIIKTDTTMKDLSGQFTSARLAASQSTDDDTINAYTSIMNDSVAAMTSYMADKNPDISKYISEYAISQPEIFGIPIGKPQSKPTLRPKDETGGVKKIRVKVIKSGQSGTIPESEFNPAIYQRL